LRGDRALVVVEMITASADVTAARKQRLLADVHAAYRAHHAPPAEIDPGADRDRPFFAGQDGAPADQHAVAERKAGVGAARVENAIVVDQGAVADRDASRMAQHEPAPEHDA